MLESFGKHFGVIFVSKLVDAGATLFILAKMFHDRTKQPEGCIGISEKCVFTLKSLSSLYRELLKRFVRAIVLLQVLLLNLKSVKRCYK